MTTSRSPGKEASGRVSLAAHAGGGRTKLNEIRGGQTAPFFGARLVCRITFASFESDITPTSEGVGATVPASALEADGFEAEAGMSRRGGRDAAPVEVPQEAK